MNRERMEHLLKIMQDVQARQMPFDWGCIYREADIYEIDFMNEAKQPKQAIDYSDILNPKSAAPLAHFCGSAACVIGYAALNPEFNRQGLVVANNINGEPDHVGLAGDSNFLSFNCVAGKFFELESETVDYIFSGIAFGNDPNGHEYNRTNTDLEEAIRRIERVLAGFIPSDEEEDPEGEESFDSWPD